ncbi:mitogen-activated protein kinase kinase kinase 4-like protein [Dinothrombium tinctorium]|uniref:Mitogen-activated protein kinase kinase kinase 4 n=1 Tax=Dinothrombium tinctorium TaxID=1965070 RepID=A0A3S3NVM5_9ACAR|nr:mitogen-activated protein kinase kinase kinase 4-like protein [Dinothrombium tinctorium]
MEVQRMQSQAVDSSEQQPVASVSGESVSNTSASEETEESGDEDSQSDEVTSDTFGFNTISGRQDKHLVANDAEDLLLHSLESDRYGHTVHKFISKYLDDNSHQYLDAILKTRKLGEKSKQEQEGTLPLQLFGASGRTIKAATRHIDVQGKKAALTRQQSQSMVNLCATETSITPPLTPNLDGCAASDSKADDFIPTKTTGIRSIIESQFTNFQENSSPNKQHDVKRRKRLQKLRLQEKDRKNEVESDSTTVSIERKSQFSCLPSRPIYQSGVRSNSISSSTSLRSLNVQAPDCPLDRIQFYKSFCQMVRKGKRDSSFVSSNNDINVGGFIELVYKQELRDLIWLEIKAWMDNRTMIDEDSHLCLQRRKILHTLHKIMKFSISSQRSSNNSIYGLSSILNDESSQTSILQQSNERKLVLESSQIANSGSEVNDLRVLIDQDKLAASVAMKLNINETNNSTSPPSSPQPISSPNADDDNCNCSETLSRLCQSCVDKETEALESVKEILEELDEIEHLYPCTKALAYDYPLYVSDQFTARLKSLYLFANIIRDLRQKINLLARLFHISNREAAGWPQFDKDQSKETELTASYDATPEVRTQDINGYSYKLNAQPPLLFTSNKQVQFNIIPKECTSSENSVRSLSGSNSPEVNLQNSLDVSTSSRNSSGHQSANIQVEKQNIFFQSKPSIYRKYVDKALKHKGLRYIYRQLSHILRPLLYRVHAALKKPSSYCLADSSSSTNAKLTVASEPPLGTKKPSPIPREYCEELSHYGVWSVAYQQMALPTFHRPFLFLLRVTVDVVHECLRLRLEQQPEKPSSVSVGQLIRECKEVLRAGVQIRQRYVNLAQTVLGEGGSDVIEAQLDSFNDDLKTMLQVYLRYLEQFMVCMQSYSSQSTSTLKQKGYLEEEWSFVRHFCLHIPGGEALAANKFCLMASDLLTSIGDFIQTEIDESFSVFNQSIAVATQDMSQFRKGILQSCRKFKGVFQEASARVCQAAAFAKRLRKDLEIAAEFRILTSTQVLLQKLKETGHIRVIAPNCINYLMFVPNYMQGNEACIWQLVDITSGGRYVETSDCDSYGYLLVALLDNQIEWSGTTVVLEPTAEATVSLSHVEVNGMLFVVSNPSQLMSQCGQFQDLMAGTLKIDKHQTSFNNSIAAALTDLKQEALEVQNKVSHSLNLIYEQLDINRVEKIEDIDRTLLQLRCIDVLHQGYKFGFEYEKSLNRLITGDSRSQLSRQIISFAFQWLKFVVNRCEKGRGLRTRWASPGLQFLMVALEPQHLQVLNNEEFKSLKEDIDKFLTHVIGSSERSPKVLLPSTPSPSINIQGPYSVLSAAPINKPLASSLNFQRSQSVVNVKGMFGDQSLPALERSEQNSKGTRLEAWAQKKNVSLTSPNRLIIKQRIKTVVNDNSSINEQTPMERVKKAIEKFDEKVDQRLRDIGIIGNVSDLIIQRTPLQFVARKVSFPWQRGFKIGEGRFGKVYTAVNNATGELIAMKEIHLQPNDHRSIKEAIDEIKIFEGIKHPNLVRYYGVEIHREELYIFMEYCNEGTLESVVQLHLPEQIVRKYTRQLLEAVNMLHENGIVHRDIKSSNIFLTSDGKLKLGDFGCCMKLKNHTTLPGELNAFVGTPAYMAPEIFMKNPIEGHGRAADIWSIGCVVLEMLTGRRPWHDLDNSYQIMFRVGMGDIPEVPSDICEEGKDFIFHCLQHNPRCRWSTGQLLCHLFIKVIDDDEIC